MTTPFGCSITQTVNSNYSRVFSFSLFITTKIMAEIVNDIRNNLAPSFQKIILCIKDRVRIKLENRDNYNVIVNIINSPV